MSLKFKFSILTFLVVFVSLCSASVVLAYRSIVQLQSNLIERDILIADKVVPILLNDFGNYYAYQYNSYTESVKKQLAKYGELINFRIINTNSEVVFESSESEASEPRLITDDKIKQVIESKDRYQDIVSINEEQVVRVIVPYIDNFDAFRNVVEFRFSLEEVQKAVRETIIFFVILLLLMSLAGIAVSLYFVGRLTAPLSLLTKASTQMSEGELGEVVVVSSHDEVGVLARSFNTMSKKISDKIVQIGEEKDKLKAAIASLPRAIIMLDLAKKIVTDNGRLDDIFGKQKSGWDAITIGKMLGSEFDLISKIDKVIKSKKVYENEELMYKAKYLKIFVSPVISKNNDMIGIVLTINDVTEARVLSRSKDEFFSIASHELRTPLTAIRGNTSMILDYYKDALKDPDLKKMVEDTHESSKRLIGIVNDFLDLSRLEQGKMQYSLSDFTLGELVTKVISELESSAKTKKIKLESRGEMKSMIYADIGKVEQVLFNMIGNSLKFTQTGSVTMEIGEKNKQVSLKIVDTGIGISPENQGLLFHKFQQAGSSILTRDGAKGTGLGLYISRLMLEGMGGKLELIESVEGKGSIFEILLPKSKVKV